MIPASGAAVQYTPADHAFMARAVRLARRGWFTAQPNPRVGCVVVRDGRPIGEGWHQTAGGPHAEINALAAAGAAARGATLYVTLEPCCHQGRTGPCSERIIAAGVSRVVAAMTDPNPRVRGGGLVALAAAGIRTDVGLGEAAARALNPGFVKRMTTGRPRVTIKTAASLDGRTALASGASQWITGPAARADVQRLRAMSDAVLTGIGTVLADDPRLTARHPASHRQPLRVVADSVLRIPSTARVLAEPGSVLLATATDATPAAIADRGAEVFRCADPAGRVDLGALLDELGRRRCNELLVEAGPCLAGALLQQRLADLVILYLAPQLLGHDARAMFELTGIRRLDQRLGLRIDDLRMVGSDVRLTVAAATA